MPSILPRVEAVFDITANWRLLSIYFVRARSKVFRCLCLLLEPSHRRSKVLQLIRLKLHVEGGGLSLVIVLTRSRGFMLVLVGVLDDIPGSRLLKRLVHLSSDRCMLHMFWHLGFENALEFSGSLRLLLHC